MPPQQSPAYALHKLVLTMDRAADQLLRDHCDLSYKRAYFLFTLQRLGTVTQHQLAITLGYSDASVSTMLAELKKVGYVTIQPSPEHARKRLVSLTPYGDKLVVEGRQLLDEGFAQVITAAGIDPLEYTTSTEKLYEALINKTKKEKS